MTEQRLTTLLHELAADAEANGLDGVDRVDTVDFAAAAWQVASQRRRTRRLAGTAVAAAACLVVAVAVVVSAPGGDGHSDRKTPPIVSATATAKAGPQLAPARSAEPGLPFAGSALPRSIDTSKTAVAALPALASSPVQRAVALAESAGEYATPAPIVVIGSDGEARRMDGIDLSWAVDSGGNRSLPLDSGSLAPTGFLAAFPQKDAVVVVDLRSGIPARLAVPGFNERVTWSPAADYLLVSGDTGATLITVRTAAVTHLAALDPADAAMLLTGGERHSLEPTSVPRIDAWWGQAFTSGSRAAVGAFSTGLHVEGAPTADPQVLAVVDLAHPSDARLLVFDWDGRYKGCCAALGWLGEDTVLFSSQGGTDPVRILAWNLKTGAVERVSEVTNSSVVSIATR